MSDLVVVVPSRGRPGNVRALLSAVRDTRSESTTVLLVVDHDDPDAPGYHDVAREAPDVVRAVLSVPPSQGGGMVPALNFAALAASDLAYAVGFLGDDHCPRTVGWDGAYLAALRELGTGIVYGDDLVQRHRLPTQCAMTTDIVRGLGYMAPPGLTHLYVDNTWLAWGTAAWCLRYLPDVVVEHRHPLAGTGQWDAGYARVNHQGMYDRDRAAFEEYTRAGLVSDVQKIKNLRSVTAGG